MDLVAGRKDGPVVDVAFSVDAKMAVPPWIQGSLRGVFPSGRAFGYIAYPPRPDGQPTFYEGYLFSGDGALIAARVIEAPWLTRLQALGEEVPLVLETADGTVRIEGETVFSTHDILHDDDMYSMHALNQEMPSFPALQQAGVRYRWDGEETYGVLTRFAAGDRIVDSAEQVERLMQAIVAGVAAQHAEAE